MAITQTYLLYAITPGTDIANRPSGAYLRFMCDSASDLPSANVIDGDRAFTNDTGRTYARSGGAWALVVAAVTSANAVITTSDTAALPIGAVTDGQFLKRVGARVVGAAGGGGGAAWGEITGTLADQFDLQAALDGKQAVGTYATGTGSASGTNTGDQTITLTGDVTGSGTGSFAATYAGVVPFALGGRAGAAATSATTGTMTVNMTTAVVTITPTGACTFNASGGVTGQITTFAITTSGVTSFVLTWGTNFRKTGTLATGTVSARFFSVSFVCINGTIWQELARTAVQT